MTACVEHTQATTRYGYTSRGGKSCLMHRVVYAEHHGLDVRTMGGVVMHSCDNPRCINVAHLTLSTHAANSADMATKGRCRLGQAHHMATLTDTQVEEVRRRFKFRCKINGGRALAAEFGTSPTTICGIVKGRNRCPRPTK